MAYAEDAFKLQRVVICDDSEEEEEYGDDAQEIPPQLSGRYAHYVCDFCQLPFVQRRYMIRLSTGEHEVLWFCLPECMAAYDWWFLDNAIETRKQRDARYQHYQNTFQRHVQPAPLIAYYNGKTPANANRIDFKTRQQNRLSWLQTCRRDLSALDAEIAAGELQLITACDESPEHMPIITPPDAKPMYETIHNVTPYEEEAYAMGPDDFLDMTLLTDDLAQLTMSK